MRRHQIKPLTQDTSGGLGAQNDIMFHNRKWRSERNFYMVAFTWTLMIILLRCQHHLRQAVSMKERIDQLEAQSSVKLGNLDSKEKKKNKKEESESDSELSSDDEDKKEK